MLMAMLAAVVLAQPPKTDAKDGPKPAPKPDAITYYAVPLKGAFGEEITAPGIREAIRAAKSKKASAVVFQLDSPGGLVADARAIAEVMEKERGDLKYYAVVTEAISASVWVLCNCDRIFFAPGGAAGAAVAFHWDPKSGHADVDAKVSAAIASIVSSAAESHGQSGAAYRAMIVKDAKLFGWTDSRGEYHLGDTSPADAKNVEQLDNENSVLAWTTEQAAKYQFGILMPAADPAALGALLGAETWQSAGDGGAAAMVRCSREIAQKAKESEKAFEAIKQARDKVFEAAERVPRQIKVADAAAPEKTVKVFYTGGGQFTPGSINQWRSQTDKAVNEWSLVNSLLDDLAKSENRVEQAVENYNRALDREYQARLVTEKPPKLKYEPVDHRLDVKMCRKTVAEESARLAANKAKNHL